MLQRVTQGFLGVFKKMSGYYLKSDLQRLAVGLDGRSSIPSLSLLHSYQTDSAPPSLLAIEYQEALTPGSEWSDLEAEHSLPELYLYSPTRWMVISLSTRKTIHFLRALHIEGTFCRMEWLARPAEECIYASNLVEP
jgi:hypothetical protein